MAQRFLALDWDQDQLHLVAATISGGSVRFTRAVLIEEAGSPTPEKAEAMGKLLRDRLKEYSLPAAPVLACVGRERLILKEVRYPAVPEHEEPGVVRFQAVKELTEAAGDMVIDYVPLPALTPGGERRAQVFVARRELVATWQAICQAAGLRLAGLVPRSHAMIAGLRALLGTGPLVPAPDPADSAVALVAVGEKWAESAILKNDTLLQARNLTLGPGLAGEIRRNLAVHSGNQSQSPVKAVYLALSGEQAALREKLVQSLEIPVHPFDPFAGAEAKELPSSGRGTFVGAVGLLRMMARGKVLPVNFVQVKQPTAPKDPNQRTYVLAACLVFVLLVGGVVWARGEISRKRKDLEGQKSDIEDLTDQLNRERDKRARMQALYDWEGVCWPDELYELSRSFPTITNNFRVRKLEGAPDRAGTRTAAAGANQRQVGPPSPDELNSRPLARLIMELKSPGNQPLEDLASNLYGAGKDSLGFYYRPEPHELKGELWKKDVKIRKRSPEEFTNKMTPPKAP